MDDIVFNHWRKRVDPISGSFQSGLAPTEANAALDLIARYTQNGAVQTPALIERFVSLADAHPENAGALYESITENLRFDDIARFESGVAKYYEARQQAAEQRTQEGVGSFFKGAVAGDLSDNDSWSKTAGQIAVGFVPFVGQIADARDTAAAANQIWNGESGGWFNFSAAMVGWIPGVGDGIKAAMRAGDKVVAEGAQAAVGKTDNVALRNADNAARVSSKPEWLQRLDAGNQFDESRLTAYPHHEVYIVKPDGSKGYYRLDSYNPITREIVSRKHTQLADIQEKGAIGHIKEIAKKYPRDSKIADVPSTDSSLTGASLKGNYILEVPVQNNPVPQGVLDAARDAGVTIRDINGKVY